VAHTCGEVLEDDATFHVRLPRTDADGAAVMETEEVAEVLALPSTIITVRDLNNLRAPRQQRRFT